MAVKSSFMFFFSSAPKITPYSPRWSKLKTPRAKITAFSCSDLRYDDDDDDKRKAPIKRSHGESFCCICGRRRFIEGATATSTALAAFPNRPSNASDLHSDDYRSVLNKVRPPRPDWYEEFHASFLDKFKDSYEAEIVDYKSQLFSNLKGKAQKVLEIGIGTGPNLKYYAGEADVQVFGMDPNRKMEKYAQAAAEAAGLPLTNFEFLHAILKIQNYTGWEAIPLGDASVDAVVGTLVLCSVKDVDVALKEVKRVLRPGGVYLFVEHVAAKDGTVLRFIQNVLDPLQQTVADGCHLTRETGMKISEAGFSGVELNKAFLSNAFYVNPQVYGIAFK